MNESRKHNIAVKRQAIDDMYIKFENIKAILNTSRGTHIEKLCSDIYMHDKQQIQDRGRKNKVVYREFQLHNILFLMLSGEHTGIHYINLYIMSKIFYKTNLHKTLFFLPKLLEQYGILWQ